MEKNKQFAENMHKFYFALTLTGEPNVAKLMTLDEISGWIIIPTQKIANDLIYDYEKNGWRYGIPF